MAQPDQEWMIRVVWSTHAGHLRKSFESCFGRIQKSKRHCRTSIDRKSFSDLVEID